MCIRDRGAPVRPVGLIVSCFRPSDDATTLQFLVPSNFFAVTSLRKAAEILETVNKETALAADCRALADEVEMALKRYATYNHPEFGTIYAVAPHKTAGILINGVIDIYISQIGHGKQAGHIGIVHQQMLSLIHIYVML